MSRQVVVSVGGPRVWEWVTERWGGMTVSMIAAEAPPPATAKIGPNVWCTRLEPSGTWATFVKVDHLVEMDDADQLALRALASVARWTGDLPARADHLVISVGAEPQELPL